MAMWCTSCGVDTEVEPNFDGMTTDQKVDLCHNWLCNVCLSDVEQEQRNADQEEPFEQVLGNPDYDPIAAELRDLSKP